MPTLGIHGRGIEFSGSEILSASRTASGITEEDRKAICVIE
jgi:hypothetical protein